MSVVFMLYFLLHHTLSYSKCGQEVDHSTTESGETNDDDNHKKSKKKVSVLEEVEAELLVLQHDLLGFLHILGAPVLFLSQFSRAYVHLATRELLWNRIMDFCGKGYPDNMLRHEYNQIAEHLAHVNEALLVELPALKAVVVTYLYFTMMLYVSTLFYLNIQMWIQIPKCGHACLLLSCHLMVLCSLCQLQHAEFCR